MRAKSAPTTPQPYVGCFIKGILRILFFIGSLMAGNCQSRTCLLSPCVCFGYDSKMGVAGSSQAKLHAQASQCRRTNLYSDVD